MPVLDDFKYSENSIFDIFWKWRRCRDFHLIPDLAKNGNSGSSKIFQIWKSKIFRTFRIFRIFRQCKKSEFSEYFCELCNSKYSEYSEYSEYYKHRRKILPYMGALKSEYSVNITNFITKNRDCQIIPNMEDGRWVYILNIIS